MPGSWFLYSFLDSTKGASNRAAVINRNNVSEIGLAIPDRLFEARKDPAVKQVARKIMPCAFR